ncbi:uncharacterized protein LOC129590243 [Paramacrobiotus metropolitanus]|uniref:uncharacterized protein LOC129590243 n=1 Tax=Paramacrobiotus metropolitanus TaxID=2943436 RepID=UPI0024457C73|nr:uncharacterized protein LOC129590243 [Paramacrobiotus metropolitanus]
MNRDRPSSSYRSTRVSLQSQRGYASNDGDPYPGADIIPYQCPATPCTPCGGAITSAPSASMETSMGMRISRVQAMKKRLDDLEPKVNCIDQKMDYVRDSTDKLRDGLLTRRKEVEDLEKGLIDRVARTEQKVQNFSREISDFKVDSETDNAALRQSVTSLTAEVACMRTWVLENLRQIHTKLDVKEQEHSHFKGHFHERLSGCEQGCAMRTDDLHCLKAEVDAKFAAIKEALSGQFPSRWSRSSDGRKSRNSSYGRSYDGRNSGVTSDRGNYHEGRNSGLTSEWQR